MADPIIVHAPPMTDAQREAVRAANEADRVWFDHHLDRNYRTRRAVFGEVPTHPDLIAVVLIKQVRRGARLRAVFYSDQGPPSEIGEDNARGLWERAMAADPVRASLLAAAEADILAGEARDG